jgi:hypothetical protein
MPDDLLDLEEAEVVAGSEVKLAFNGRDLSLMEDFFFGFAARHVTAGWDMASGALVEKWLQGGPARGPTPVH